MDLEFILDVNKNVTAVKIGKKVFDLSTEEGKQKLIKKGYASEIIKAANTKNYKVSKAQDDEYSYVDNITYYDHGRFLSKGEKIVLATALGAAILGGSIWCLTSCTNNMKNESQNEDENTSTSQEDSTINSINKAIDSLNFGIQRDSFIKMNNLAKNFNTKLADQIYPWEDEHKPYLTSKEIVSLFTIANSKTYTTADFYNIFESSVYLQDCYNIVKNIPLETVYKLLNKDRTGIGELFANEEDKNYYNQFEDLIIKYNTIEENKKASVGKEIKEYLTMISKLDAKHYGVSEIILLHGSNYAEINQIITSKEHKALNERLNAINCDITERLIAIRNEVSAKSETELGANRSTIKALIGINTVYGIDEDSLFDQEYIINRKIKDRNVNLNYLEKVATEEEQLKSKVPVSNDTKTSTTKEVTVKKEQKVTKEEAIKAVGSKEVAKKEQQAKENAKTPYKLPDGNTKETLLSEANERELDRAKGMEVGYNKAYEKAYDTAFASGNKISKSSITITYQGNIKYKDSYEEGFNSMIEKAINAGYEKGLADRKKALSIPDEKVISTKEEPIKEETKTTTTNTTKETTTTNQDSDKKQNEQPVITTPKKDSDLVVEESVTEEYLTEEELEELESGISRVRK